MAQIIIHTVLQCTEFVKYCMITLSLVMLGSCNMLLSNIISPVRNFGVEQLFQVCFCVFMFLAYFLKTILAITIFTRIILQMRNCQFPNMKFYVILYNLNTFRSIEALSLLCICMPFRSNITTLLEIPVNVS